MPVKRKAVAIKQEHVVIKKEPVDKVAAKKAVPVKAEAKVKKEVAVKKEANVKKEVKVKQEKHEAASVIAKEKWTPMTHFKHQVAFLNEVVKPPWKLCFGALGTGIIGIQPQTEVGSSSSSSSSAPLLAVKQEVKEEANDDEDDGVKDADAKALPSDATIVLLLNGPSCGPQSRNGTFFGGYHDSLDKENKTMVWTSQRGDRNNKRIKAICAHSQNGGRIAVGIRDAISQGSSACDNSHSFKLLGFVSHIDELKEAKFLVSQGDDLIVESGRNFLHKNITAACLDAGLKAGVGLSTKRYPLPAGTTEKFKFCCKCCYITPTCRLHFKELNEEGVLAYRPFERLSLKRQASKIEVIDEEDWKKAPRKRLRCKQELPDGHSCIKKEPEDDKEEPEREPEDEEEKAPYEELELPPTQSRADLDDNWEPPDPPSLLADDAEEMEIGTLDSCLSLDALDVPKSLEVASGQQSRFTSFKQLESSTLDLSSSAELGIASIDLD